MANPSVLLAVDHDAEASPAIRFAALELRRLLFAMTGRSIVVVDAALAHPDAITLGEAAELGADPGDDVIDIDVRGTNGTIRGSNSRSVLIAVYRYLTELGCRFVRPGPDGEFVPSVDLAQTGVTLRERAAHRHRGICIEGGSSVTNLLDMIDWLPKVGLNSYFIQFDSPHVFLRSWYERRGDPASDAPAYPETERSAAVHRPLLAELEQRGLIHHAVGHGWTSEAIGVRSDGWDTVTGSEFRRELVAEVDGVRELWQGVPLLTELCYSNPAARSAMARSIADHAAAHPEIDVLHVWLSDGSANHCECAECSKQRPSDWYVMVLNEVDLLLTEAGTPTTIALLAYHQLLWPPMTETLANPDRFVFMFAPIHRDPRIPITEAGDLEVKPYLGNNTARPERNEELLGLLQAWRSCFAGSAFDFDYHLMWQHCFDPGRFVIARTLHHDIRDLQSIGLDGLISCQAQRAFVPDGFAMMIMARTLWDTTVAFDEVLDDYVTATYGPAGAEVAEHLRWLSDTVAQWNLDYHLVAEPTIDRGAVSEVVARLAQLSELIDRNRDTEHPVQAISWQHLAAQTQIWASLCEVWDAVATGDRETIFERWAGSAALIWRLQENHQPVLDAGNLSQTIERYLSRLFPAA